MSDPTTIPDPTHTDEGPEQLCLLLGASFWGRCRHVRCRAIHAEVAEAEWIDCCPRRRPNSTGERCLNCGAGWR